MRGAQSPTNSPHLPLVGFHIHTDGKTRRMRSGSAKADVMGMGTVQKPLMLMGCSMLRSLRRRSRVRRDIANN